MVGEGGEHVKYFIKVLFCLLLFSNAEAANVTLHWDAPLNLQDLTGYRLYRVYRKEDTNYSYVKNVTVTGTSYVDSVSDGQIYFYYVTAM